MINCSGEISDFGVLVKCQILFTMRRLLLETWEGSAQFALMSDHIKVCRNENLVVDYDKCCWTEK